MGKKGKHRREPDPVESVGNELYGIRRWIRNLRSNRGKWPERWRASMLRHYNARERELAARYDALLAERESQSEDDGD